MVFQEHTCKNETACTYLGIELKSTQKESYAMMVVACNSCKEHFFLPTFVELIYY